jgi:hypothetical protein
VIISRENATYRIQGSIAFTGAARAVWMVCKDHNDASRKRRYLQASKTNLAPDTARLGLSFQIDWESGSPRVDWLQTDVAIPVSQMLAIPEVSREDRTRARAKSLNHACDWLTMTLDKSMPQTQLKVLWTAEGLTNITVQRAKKELGICKMFFNTAPRKKLVDENPFAGQKAATLSNSERFHFISKQDAERLIEAAPDWQ